MGVPVHSVCLLTAALLLVTGAGATLFKSDQLYPTFRILGSRQCVPADLDSSSTAPAAPNCAQLVVQESQLPIKFLSKAFSPSMGWFDSETAVNGPNAQDDGPGLFQTIKNHHLTFSTEPTWVADNEKMIDDCQSNVQQGLTLRQTAVYAYTCLKWSLFADCDSQQAEDGELDAEGQQRRADFFYSDCPLSARTLQELLEAITGRTFLDCGLDSPAGYAATIENMRCLLHNFQNGVNMDYDALKSALNSAFTDTNAQEPKALLDEVVTKCESNRKTEDFVKCWAEAGVLNCVYKEANEIAAAHPELCKLSA
ncbi:hypothetical protein FJT64_024512 [Amphibalanus amphitrite]|uniref:Uncharacterized protein n=1 Tax=Amphibalanus amphitrite TaxID=1232801 RepID=A0A6A4WBY4_AMPAM|nr:hypothetical protein FJT64_024512 [Amphibalanus amphitrite]